MKLVPLDHEFGWYWESVKKILKLNGFTYAPFLRWMYGQTYAISDEGQAIYYPHDVERYLTMGVPKATILD